MKRFLGLYAMLCTLLVACFASCSSTQKITVRQEQEGQTQETVIESDTRVQTLSVLTDSCASSRVIITLKSSALPPQTVAHSLVCVGCFGITRDSVVYDGSWFRSRG